MLEKASGKFCLTRYAVPLLMLDKGKNYNGIKLHYWFTSYVHLKWGIANGWCFQGIGCSSCCLHDQNEVDFNFWVVSQEDLQLCLSGGVSRGRVYH